MKLHIWTEITYLSLYKIGQLAVCANIQQMHYLNTMHVATDELSTQDGHEQTAKEVGRILEDLSQHSRCRYLFLRKGLKHRLILSTRAIQLVYRRLVHSDIHRICKGQT